MSSLEYWRWCSTHAQSARSQSDCMTTSFYRHRRWSHGISERQPGQSFILAGFIISLPRPGPCGSEQPIHRERPVATQNPLRNCVDHLAAPSHIYAPPRVETGQWSIGQLVNWSIGQLVLRTFYINFARGTKPPTPPWIRACLPLQLPCHAPCFKMNVLCSRC